MPNATPRPATKHHFTARDFAAPTRRALLKRGIVVVGLCSIPDMSSDMPWANSSRAYRLDDNGTHRIRTHAEVRAMAEVAS